MRPGVCFTTVPWWSWWRRCRPEKCLGPILCCIDLPQDADLAPKVTFSKTEKPVQSLQLTPKSLAGEMGEDLVSLILAPSLCSSKPSTEVCVEPCCCPCLSHPHSVLHIGNTFRRHPWHALDKDGFYANMFSQHGYQEPHVPSSRPGHRACPACQPTRWKDL